MKTHNDALDEFFNLSSDLLCIANYDGYFLKLSHSWEILGYPLHDLIGKRFAEFIHPDDLSATMTLHFLSESKMPISEFKNRYRCKDGSYREIEWRFQRRDDLYYAVAHDVTEIKQTVSAFRESELRYQSVVNSMSEGIVLHAQDGSIEACNKSAETMLGLTTDQMMGRTSIDPRWRAVHEDGSPFPGETHPAMVTLQTGKPVSNVVMGVHKPTGELTWILVNTQPIFHMDTDKPSVVASFTDITQMKQISEALRQSESRFRTISEMISDYTYGFSVLENGALQHEWTAGAFESITGYTSDEMDKRGGWGSIFYPEDLPIAAKRFKTLLSGQESVDEFRIITKSGQIRWLKDYGKPIWDEKEGRVVYIFGAAQDLTERKLAEKQRLDLATEQERLNIITDFIATTSHELRTPLSVINTSLYLLMKTQDEAKRQIKANQITEQVTYLNKVINQLHEVVRLDRLRDIELVPLSITYLVQMFVTVWSVQYPNRHIETTFQPNLPTIYTNTVHMTLMLNHLIENALYFSAENSTIEIEAHLVDAYVALSIEDNGIGIAPEHLENIFNPFYKVNSARTQGNSRTGVGVGLTIVRRIMQLHHGYVGVRSQLNEGTVFTLYFPSTPPP